MIATPTYSGPDRRGAAEDRRSGERRVSFDDVPMIVDRRRSGTERRRGSDRRNQAAMILNTPMLRRRPDDIRA